MQKNFSLLKSLAAAMSVVLSGACAEQDYEIPASELYARSFIKSFGVPDSDHTWSFARRIDAIVSTDGDEVVQVYTDAPGSESSVLLAEIKASGKTTAFHFDTDCDCRSVFVRRVGGDKVLGSGWYSLENGMLKAVASDDINPDAPVTQTIRKHNKQVFVNRIKPATIEALRNSGYESYDDLNEAMGGTLDMEAENIEIPNFYFINYFNGRSYTRRDGGHTGAQLRPLFYKTSTGDAGVFQESSDQIEKYVKPGIIDPSTIYSVEHTGVVTMDCIWRGANNADSFGYYYYDPADGPITPEKLWKIRKFIVLNGRDYVINAESDLTRYKKPDGNGGYTDWIRLRNTVSNDLFKNDKDVDKYIFDGSVIPLIYYGPDGEAADGIGTPSYCFPEGTKIGFFIFHAGYSDKRFFFSNSAMNYYLFNPKHKDDKGALYNCTFCAHFKYDGETYIGMEDGGQKWDYLNPETCKTCDHDMNDIVFIVHNLWPPGPDITPDDLPEPKSKTWTLACEDLGDTDDFDFNDVVLNIEYVSGHDHMHIYPQAAGGRLSSEVWFCPEGQEAVNIGEIHSLLGVGKGVIAGTGMASINMDAVLKSRTVKVPEGFSLSDMKNGLGAFRIKTTHPDGSTLDGNWITPQSNGIAPQMLLLPYGWKWPSERQHIHHAYPDFDKWVKDQDNTDWLNNRDDLFIYFP